MKRVVITGIGVIAPNGFSPTDFWDNANKGISYVIHDEDMASFKLKSSILCRIKNFQLSDHVDLNDYPELNQLDEFVQYAVAAGENAIKDADIANILKTHSDDAGIIFSSAIGGTPTIVKIFEELTDAGKTELQHKPVGARFYNSGMFNYPAMLLANKYAVAGPCTSVTTGCTAGLDALGVCFDLIRTGEVKMMMAGASEAPLTGLTYATLDVINSLATTDCKPEESSRPFDAKRSGFVISEGAVVLVLEDLDHALQRKAKIYAEIKSFASVSNAFHMTDLPSDGLPMAQAIKRALSNANMQPEEIHYVNAHGSSTPQNDIFETAAYKEAFGDAARNIPISSIKSMIGHSLASASLMGTLGVIGAINLSKIHPTINYQFPDPACDLDYVPNVAREQRVDAGVVTASGFGGIHSAAIFSKYK